MAVCFQLMCLLDLQTQSGLATGVDISLSDIGDLSVIRTTMR